MFVESKFQSCGPFISKLFIVLVDFEIDIEYDLYFRRAYLLLFFMYISV